MKTVDLWRDLGTITYNVNNDAVVCWNKKESSSASEPWATIAQRYNES